MRPEQVAVLFLVLAGIAVFLFFLFNQAWFVSGALFFLAGLIAFAAIGSRLS